MNHFNTRILVIDDEDTILESFRDILMPPEKRLPAMIDLTQASSDLFGTSDDASDITRTHTNQAIQFELDTATNGHLGVEYVRKSMLESNPYAAIFVDMRMPGWDGLETVQHIRNIDKRAEIIFVTAYSDHSIDDIIAKAGGNITYYCKPFSVDEIRQLATKSVYEWNKAKNLEDLIDIISHFRARHWDIDALLKNVLSQVADILGCYSAIMARRKNGKLKPVMAIGVLTNDVVARKYLERQAQLTSSELYTDDDIICFNLEEYDIMVLFDAHNQVIHSERIYIVRLFLEQAAAAMKQLDLQAELIQKEKLSAVGKAMSMLSHDLRSVIGSIEPMAALALDAAEGADPFVVESLSMIRKSAQRGMDIVSGIMDFVRNREALKTDITLEELLTDIHMLLRGFAKESSVTLDIRTVDLSEEQVIRCDASKILRVLVNLARNGIEAVNKVADPRVTLEISQQAEMIRFTVSDNGPGIPSAIEATLFEPFATHGKSSGTGMGLAICKQFIEAHGGTLTVQSSPQGAVFIADIPIE
ncbi:MAG: response regulator [Spartobacteria bacterium]|nr:response regulator [Spartobacteria bacterium]